MRTKNSGLGLSIGMLSIIAASSTGALAQSEEVLQPNAAQSEIERAFNGLSGEFLGNSFAVPPGLRRPTLPPGASAQVPDSPRGPRTVSVLGIQFREGSATLTDQSQAVTDIIANILARRADRIRVVGHTDASGDRQQNISLSQDRALTVAYYLVHVKNIDSGRVTYTGMGPDQPITGLDPYDRRNRRVTFVLED